MRNFIHMNELKRNCPNCGFIKEYKTRDALLRAATNNAVCRKCAAKQSGFLDRYASAANSSGENNPFYGHCHSAETKNKIGALNKRNKWTEKRKETASVEMSGSGNPMYGKRVYDSWLAKYGKMEADRLENERINKLRIAMSGSGNPMYGKPSPNGAGNGWCGWYKSWFFRSLGELSYVVNVLERANQTWVSAESQGIKISYTDWKGSDRTYVPDFVANNTIIECKPKKLHQTPTVQAKAQAAEKYCVVAGYDYKIVSPPAIDFEWLCEAVDANVVQFTKIYAEKFQSRRQGILHT